MDMTPKTGYLSTKTVEKGEIIEFLDEGVRKPNEKYTYQDGSPKIDNIFKVKYKGEVKELRLNNVSNVNIGDAFGYESKKWIGRKAKIMLLPTPKGDNKMIVLDPILEEEKTAEIAWDE